jgi:predicted AlkP superfamily phosphohydrolase/phosphomutase
MNPGKHGIFGFLKNYESSPVTSKDIKSKPFWKIASENGKRVIVTSVPMTYPPEEINGIIVSGYESSEEEIFTYPENLTYELREKGYKIEALDKRFKPGDEDELLKKLYYTEEKRAEVAMELMIKEKWDIFVVVFTGTDRIQHYFWRYMENKDQKYGNEILKYYKKIDGIIGNFFKKAGDANIIIMSDHGFGPAKGKIYLNYYFMERGDLKFKSPITYWLIKLGLTQQNLVDLFEKLQKIPFFRFTKFLAEKFSLTKVGKITPALTYNDVDFSKTKAYAGNFGGQIFLNVKGRDTKGFLEKSEYKKFITNLMEDLSRLRGPNGKKLFNRIEELYKGPYVKNAPDLIVVESNGYTTVGWLGYNTLVGNYLIQTGNHRRNGIVILYGKNVKKGVIKNANIIDLAPTILEMIRVKIPTEMDGKSLLRLT